MTKQCSKCGVTHSGALGRCRECLSEFLRFSRKRLAVTTITKFKRSTSDVCTLLQEALKKHGTVAKASRAMGVSRKTLYRALVAANVQPPTLTAKCAHGVLKRVGCEVCLGEKRREQRRRYQSQSHVKAKQTAYYKEYVSRPDVKTRMKENTRKWAERKKASDPEGYRKLVSEKTKKQYWKDAEGSREKGREKHSRGKYGDLWEAHRAFLDLKKQLKQGDKK